MHDTLVRYNRALGALERRLGRRPTPAEVAERLGMDPAQAEALEQLTRDPISLESEIRGAEDKTVQDMVADTTIAPPHAGLDRGRLEHAARTSIQSLSEREREVLVLIGQGMSNAEIGGTLHLSEATVKGYVSSVLGKIGAVNRVQAALVAYRGGLIA